jgi:hypothetical protein
MRTESPIPDHQVRRSNPEEHGQEGNTEDEAEEPEGLTRDMVPK